MIISATWFFTSDEAKVRHAQALVLLTLHDLPQGEGVEGENDAHILIPPEGGVNNRQEIRIVCYWRVRIVLGTLAGLLCFRAYFWVFCLMATI